MAGASTKAVSDEVEGQWRSATGLAMVLDSIHTSADPSRSRSRHHSPLSLKEKVEVSSGPAGVPICTLAPLLLVAWMTCGAWRGWRRALPLSHGRDEADSRSI